MTTETKDTRVRFVPKKVDEAWRVYDTFEGSYPYQKPVLGLVAQDVPEADAKVEADRLNALHFEGKVPTRKREKRQGYSSADDED